MKSDALGARKLKRGRPVDDLSSLPMTVDEMRRTLRRCTGKWRGRNIQPNKKITMLDIALMSRIERKLLGRFSNRRLGKFSTHSAYMGLKRMARLCNILSQIDAGMITKSQYGVYHFHEQPVKPPVRTMQVSLGAGKIMPGMKVATVQRMPSFNKLFGGK